MRIAVLGGGFAGLSASFYLAKKGHEVTLIEKEQFLGGLAQGFKAKDWDWYLERAIHHLFSNDYDILNFAKDVGFNKILFRSPETASLYRSLENNYRTIPLDTPQDLLKFPYLSLPAKLRAGFTLAFLKASPFFSLYEKQTAEKFLKKTMGEEAWNVLWQELFRKKFGKYAGNILSSFIWARIKKRTKKLGYPKGGFQKLLDQAEKTIKKQVNLKKGVAVESVHKERNAFEINGQLYDAVISTLPTPILTKLTANLFPQSYISRLKKIKYQHAISLIAETKKPLLEKAYWLNMCVADNPIMGLFQHTNFMDKKNYAGNHILYVGNYVDFENPLVKMTNEEIRNWYLPQLKKINPKYSIPNTKYYVFKGPFAQPIFDKSFVKNKPDFETPVKNFYIANLDMTYPYDRGTNYAVKLGREVSDFF